MNITISTPATEGAIATNKRGKCVRHKGGGGNSIFEAYLGDRVEGLLTDVLESAAVCGQTLNPTRVGCGMRAGGACSAAGSGCCCPCVARQQQEMCFSLQYRSWLARDSPRPSCPGESSPLHRLKS